MVFFHVFDATRLIENIFLLKPDKLHNILEKKRRLGLGGFLPGFSPMKAYSNTVKNVYDLVVV